MKKQEIKFSQALHRDGTDAPELIGVILQNYETRAVLYGASMSRETLAETLASGWVVLYSQSRKCRWLKGETSGDRLRVRKIFLNCNSDQLLIQVSPMGKGVCHEKDEKGVAKPTCFHKLLWERGTNQSSNQEKAMKNMILGIPSGSLLEATITLLRTIGIEVVVNGRNFICEVRGSAMFSQALIMRPNDLPQAVKAGVVDVAITGLDMVFEAGLENELCKIVELQFSKKSRMAARIVVFGREDESDEIVDAEDVVVCGEYIILARTMFKKAGIQFSTGSTEIKVANKAFGFRYGVGVVESGQSLKDNGLKIIKTILTSPVVLIAREESPELQIFGQMLHGVLEGERYRLVKFNANFDDQARLLQILPAMESPTISQLADGAMAFETAVLTGALADTIIAIGMAGGRKILIQDIRIAI